MDTTPSLHLPGLSPRNDVAPTATCGRSPYNPFQQRQQSTNPFRHGLSGQAIGDNVHLTIQRVS